MIITCEKCGTRFNLDESLLDADGSKVRCSQCRHIFTAFPPLPDLETEPELEFDDLDFNDTEFEEDGNLSETDFQDPMDPGKQAPEELELEGAESDGLELELEDSEPDEIEIEIESAEPALEGEEDLAGEPDLSGGADDDLADLEQDEILSGDTAPEFDLAFDLDEIKPDPQAPDTRQTGTSDVAGDAPDLPDEEMSLSLEEEDLLADMDLDPDDIDGLEDKNASENGEQEFEGLDDYDDPDFDDTDMDDLDPPPDKTSHEPPPPRRAARASLIQPPDPEETLMDDGEEPVKKKSAIGLPVLVALILFVFAGGGFLAATLLGYKIPFLPEIQIPFLQQYLPEKKADPVSYPDPIPDQKSVAGRFITNDMAGELFIITGKIENPAQIPYRRIQVKGTLFQKDKQPVMSRTVFCGNIIPEETLRTGSMDDVISQLKTPGGTANINDKIMPGDTVPFMLVFSDLPQNLENFTVEVVGFEMDR